MRKLVSFAPLYCTMGFGSRSTHDRRSFRQGSYRLCHSSITLMFGVYVEPRASY